MQGTLGMWGHHGHDSTGAMDSRHMGLEKVRMWNIAGHQDVTDSKDIGIGTVGTWDSTGHQDSRVTSLGTMGTGGGPYQTPG